MACWNSDINNLECCPLSVQQLFSVSLANDSHGEENLTLKWGSFVAEAGCDIMILEVAESYCCTEFCDDSLTCFISVLHFFNRWALQEYHILFVVFWVCFFVLIILISVKR